MPLVMLSTPEATPDCRLGADAMMAALLGGVNRAEADTHECQGDDEHGLIGS